MTRDTRFWTFNQNATHGVLLGPHHVIVEARSIEEARERLVNSIFYNDDKDSYGPRWPVDHENDPGSTRPEVYGQDLFEYLERDMRVTVVVLRADGTQKTYAVS